MNLVGALAEPIYQEPSHADLPKPGHLLLACSLLVDGNWHQVPCALAPGLAEKEVGHPPEGAALD
jgi:hypothetical protein